MTVVPSGGVAPGGLAALVVLAAVAALAAWLAVDAASSAPRRLRGLDLGRPVPRSSASDRPRRGRRAAAPRLRLSPPAASVLVTAVGAGVWSGVALGVGTAAVGGVLLRRRSRAGRAREVARARAAATRACAAVAAEVRAGAPASQALAGAAAGVPATGPAAAPAVRRALAEAGHLERLGGGSGGPLVGTGVPELRDLATALLVATRSGAAPAVAVDRVAGAAREDQRAREEAEASLAGARATTGLLALLPVVGLGLGVLVGADPLAVLLHGSLGAALLLGGTALALLGLLWGDRVVDSAAPR